LSCMLGGNREIFFPKLDEEQMMTFDSIAENLLKEHGYEVLRCNSDAEAVDKSDELRTGTKFYPVHFEKSDTSGEKAFEEFFTDAEQVDMRRFESLGVIMDKPIPNKENVMQLYEKLEMAFQEEDANKAEVVKIIGEYLPNFSHIETGKSLDSKM